MSSRWISATVGGALIGMLAVGAVALVGRNDPTTGSAAPAPTDPPGTGTSGVPHTITVSGEGKVTVKPDTASIYMGVSVTSDTATEALRVSNEKASALIAALKAAGVANDDITTSGLSIYPNYTNDGRRVVGYTSSNSVTVTVRVIGNAGPVIDAAAAAAGDNVTVGSISFFVADPEKVISLARADAIANAKKRAGEYAAAADATVGAVLQISEVGITQPPVIWTGGREKDAAAAGVPIQTGTQDLTVSVTVMYALA